VVSIAASPVQPGRRRWLPPLVAAVVLIVALAARAIIFF